MRRALGGAAVHVLSGGLLFLVGSGCFLGETVSPENGARGLRRIHNGTVGSQIAFSCDTEDNDVVRKICKALQEAQRAVEVAQALNDSRKESDEHEPED